MKTLRYCVSSWCAGPQTEARMWRWVTTRPALRKRTASRSYSFGVSLIGAPSRVTRRLSKSITTPATSTRCTGWADWAACLSAALQPRGQFADAERLLDIIVGAEIERLDFLRLAIARGEHDHRRRRELADVAQNILAVPVGQTEVENDQIGRAGRGRPQGLGAGLGRLHLKAGGGERDGEKPLNLRLIVDDQNARPCHAAGLDAIGVD